MKANRTQELMAKATFYADSILDTIREPLLILSSDFKILRANQSFYDTFKMKPEQTESFSLFEMGGGKWDLPALRGLLRELSVKRASFDDLEVEQDFGAAGYRFLKLNAKLLGTNIDRTQMILLAMEDVTDRMHIEKMLTELSLTDELTHLYNRRGFLALAEDRLKLARRTKSGLWLFFADADRLKHINDTFGHQEGDAALVDIAGVLKETFRESDVVARIAGDEFIVLASTGSEDYESRVSARLKQNLEELNKRRSREYKLSLSMGASHFSGSDEVTLDQMMEKADSKLYEAKNGKKTESLNRDNNSNGSFPKRG